MRRLVAVRWEDGAIMPTDKCFFRSYDFDTLDKIPKDKVVIFVVSLARAY